MFNNSRPRPNTSAPRQKDRPTKAERKLAARIEDFETNVQKGPMPTEFHRPGSLKK